MKVDNDIISVIVEQYNMIDNDNPTVIPVYPHKLARDRYRQLDEVYKRLRGKWKTGVGHVFPYDPRPLLRNVVATEEMPEKNPLDYFPTPIELARELVTLADICDCEEWSVLEPSAGNGQIVQAILEATSNVKVVAVEKDPLNVLLLKERIEVMGYTDRVRVVKGDFLEFETDDLFHAIVMNPPFKAWREHIGHAVSLLKEHVGKLVSIVPKDVTRRKKKDRVFEEQILAWSYYMPLEGGEFKESGTMIPTAIIEYNPPWQNRSEHEFGIQMWQFELMVENDQEAVKSMMRLIEKAKQTVDMFGMPDRKIVVDGVVMLRDEIFRKTGWFVGFANESQVYDWFVDEMQLSLHETELAGVPVC